MDKATRERLKAQAAAQKAAAAQSAPQSSTAAASSPPPAERPPQRGGAVVTAPAAASKQTGKPKKNQITFACGHFGGPPKCGACRHAEQKERADRHRARRAARQQHESHRPRLPDGSRFSEMVYDGAAQRWSGTLIVPGAGEFSGSASGIRRLLEDLDQQYRQAAAQQMAAAS